MKHIFPTNAKIRNVSVLSYKAAAEVVSIYLSLHGKHQFQL